MFNNSTNQTTPADGYDFPVGETAIITMYVCYVVVFVVGTIGNAFVVYLVAIRGKLERSFDLQIVSLAVSDFLAALITPLVSIHDLYTRFNRWHLLGTLGCKIMIPMNHMTTIVSSFTLVMISAERIRIIVSVRRIHRSKKNYFLANLVIWILAIGIVSSYMNTLEVRGACVEQWNREDRFIYFTIYTILSCLLPVVLLVGIYTIAIIKLSRNKVPSEDKRSHEKRRKQNKEIMSMFGLIAVLFFALTTPFTVQQFVYLYYYRFDFSSLIANANLLDHLTFMFYTLSQFNFCVNPFIYAKMQKQVFKIFKSSKTSTKSIDSTTSTAVLLADRKDETNATKVTGDDLLESTLIPSQIGSLNMFNNPCLSDPVG